MANDEVLGPRKTMFVLVIVVGCFAVLWPRILSPLLAGGREQLKPNQFDRDAVIKQERPPIRGSGPHPALKERGRAIPPGAPTPPSRGPVPLPPHVRVRSPLQGYYEVEVQPPPIPGMRPPLGSPGGPVAAPKSSMGLVMPIYTICIIVFFVYTLSKILFKRTGTVPYDQVQSDPQFRRRVFRDDSRASPDNKFGHKEKDTIVTAISGLVAEVQQQMEASYAQSQQRQEAPDNNARPYTNGTVPNADNAPVRIVATEYVEPSREKTPEAKEKESTPEITEPSPEKTQPAPVEKESTPEEKETTPEVKESTPEEREPTPESKEPTPEKEASPEKEDSPEPKRSSPEQIESEEEEEELEEEKEESPEPEKIKIDHKSTNGNAIKHAEVDVKKSTESFLDEARGAKEKEEDKKQSTPELLEEALQESEEEVEEIEEVEEEEEEEEEEEDEVAPSENSAVKVVGMEVSASSRAGWAPPRAPPRPAHIVHSAEDVKSIYLQTEIPQQSKVLVADFAQGRPAPAERPGKRAPLVVSGKMTLSLIQDAPRDTPERDAESTVDDFTTASAMTQHAENNSDDYSEEEVEEEVEEEELEEDEKDEVAPGNARK
ncbi:hypothetical protein JYU34_014033 [Plutella xylostella]|uniref:Resistance to inhibitors of cholinesterase protein 3 N-terminal domain-containing protein n=1 Tax=Plutella xylostella TaxID=51655 RepID=A0ABQ7Q8X6_PLUXY|nr:hypothetical protein JYU34_014033 [Plutella xylostella]